MERDIPQLADVCFAAGCLCHLDDSVIEDRVSASVAAHCVLRHVSAVSAVHLRIRSDHRGASCGHGERI